MSRPRGGATTRTPSRGRASGGRPSRDEALQLGERILDAATGLFFGAGFGATSMEAVAQRAGVSKRALYHRHADKAALFSAVVHRTIERMRPPAGVPLIGGATLADVLQHLATLILGAALSAPALALHRLIVAESGRFPELAAVVQQEGGRAEALRLIAGILEAETRSGRISLDAPAFAAEQFLHMVIALPQQRALAHTRRMTTAEQAAWARDVVNLFVNGCRGWETDCAS